MFHLLYAPTLVFPTLCSWFPFPLYTFLKNVMSIFLLPEFPLTTQSTWIQLCHCMPWQHFLRQSPAVLKLPVDFILWTAQSWEDAFPGFLWWRCPSLLSPSLSRSLPRPFPGSRSMLSRTSTPRRQDPCPRLQLACLHLTLHIYFFVWFSVKSKYLTACHRTLPGYSTSV